MKTVIGIDNGTQSTKVIFYDFESKKIVAEASAPHDLIARDDGTREQEAEWWITALDSCFKAIPADVKRTAVAAGVSGQQHGFVPVDENGEVLSPVKLWCDTATASQCTNITETFGGEDKLLSQVGNLVLPGYTVGKILWLKENNPDLYARLHKVLLPHDYLNFYLTGEYVMEYGDASGTGLLDIRNRVWHRDIIEAAVPGGDLMSKLPKLIEADKPAGRVTAEAAAKFGIPEGIIVSSGGGDNMMGAIGTGSVAPGMMTMSLGTSGTMYGYSDSPIIDPEGNLAAFCSSTGGWLPLLCTMNCTVSTELLRDLLKRDVKEMNELAGKALAGSEGIINLPFYNGERTPNFPNGKGCLVGMTMANVKEENILRSAMEAAIFGMKIGLESFEKLGFTPTQIRLTGGGAKSALWRQIAADILDVPVVVPVQPEAAALGGALQGLWAYTVAEGTAASIASIVEEHVTLDPETSHEPGPNAETYRKVYREYKQYIESLSALFK